MQKYSLGVQEFSKLRDLNCLYVDKTNLIYELVQGNCFFLSRPRRFGKSLLVNTLKEIFLGNKHFFEGLYIYDKIQWESYPVLQFSFAKSDFHKIGLEAYFYQKIDEMATQYNIKLNKKTVSSKIEELIKKLYEKYNKGVVLLIDEYDKPIIEFLGREELHIALENREIMRQFYSPLKDLDAKLRFIFITGVSKFSKVSIFSDLNHLEDITMVSDYATLLGYTEDEITHYFKDRIIEISQKEELTYQDCFDKMRLWYNGYSWNGKNKVYSPTSMLKFLQHKEFDNYWFETGTPSFLVKLMSNNFTYNIDNIEVGRNLLSNFQLENIEEITLLFQTGYLTIKERDDDIYTLTYPNQEVRNSMLQYLLTEYSYKNNVKPIVRDIYRALGSRDFEKLFDCLNSLLGEIPYQIFDEKQEKYYHAVIFLTFRLLGYYAVAEPSVAKGRIDAVVETDNGIFIFEFKINGTIQDAMKQIHQNKYYQRYIASSKEIYLIAVVCKNKQIEQYEVQIFEK